MSLRLADLPVSYVRNSRMRALLLTAVAVLFAVMVARVAMAAMLGVVIAVFLRPVYEWLHTRLGRPAPSALLALMIVIVPSLAVLTYGYLEVRRAATYLAENTAAVAERIEAAVAGLPFVDGDVGGTLHPVLDQLAAQATGVPAGVREAIGGVAVAAAMFLFTAFYVLTQGHQIVAYLRSRVPDRYTPLAGHLERSTRGVLYGAIYATLVAQALKSLWLLALLLVFGVPIPFTLSLLAFLIGFFPVVGSWTVYLPAAGWLLVFDGSPVQAALLVVLAFVVSTPLITFYIRPKLAADRSHVLDFYWMFVGLIAGVYTFGVPGVVLGPVVVGLLKALLDVVTDDESWRRPDSPDPDDGTPRAEIFSEEATDGEPPPDLDGLEPEPA